MKTVFITNIFPHEIHYYTPQEVLKLESSIFRCVINICTFLTIDIPNIAIGTIVPGVDPDTGELFERMATTWTPDEIPALENPLVYIGVAYPNGDPLNDMMLIANIAHELRHIWQKKVHPKRYAKTAKGYRDTLFNEAEIDADAFAIMYLSGGKGMESVGSVICDNYYTENSDAFELRMKRAEEIRRAQKNGYFKKIVSFLKKT